MQRSTAELQGADSVSIIGCDAANSARLQLYIDERGVCRVYEMSIDAGVESLALGPTVRSTLLGGA